MNGTYYLVSNTPSSLPSIDLMTSTWAELPHKIHWDLPNDKHLRVIDPRTAKELLGTSVSRIRGLTWMCHDYLQCKPSFAAT